MTMRILFHGAPARTSVTPDMLSDAALQATGHNTGNLLIGGALESQLEGASQFFFSLPPPERAREEFDLIAIAASNFIFHRFDFGYLGNFIEKSGLPCVVVGLGAQAKDRSIAIEIPEGTQRFLRVASERTTLIGVRGTFTAEVLDRMGIRNVQVVGCPSFYPLQCPPAMTLPDRLPSPDQLVLNGSRNVVEHSFDPETMLAVEREVFRYALKHDVDYVLQSELPEILFHRGLGEAPMSQLAAIRDILDIDPATTDEQFEQFIRARCKTFFNIAEWAAFIRTKTLSLGSRFHGNVMAMTNGVPAVLIAHDTRTEEMAEHIGLPRLKPAVGKPFSLEGLLAEADASQFNALYPRRRLEYIEFLKKNGLKSKLSS
ncbi:MULTISPECIES: polysaccharide pyruvyl transferase family protein [unclassified Azospirillum]|jgi:hypothetical protein|uniref:polysaccharide pyruvyl transferase family protein n=1 Tax=unclassified Azospirillum TaxID=2630922 RepID=UPI000B6A28FC|nr:MULTISPECIES: polysaccharide pyruvyl transferase family protein [unclassified Azospirillum]SNS52444.1 Polysaccharide pyruvyl transferase [Azospirillum sp. RU38E]SNS69020.1 Polysaccharide pyruvyl transferase [Azospirillum sp. RU37A]